jgi:N-acetyl-anhydromuramyl-L-alanine amidase AmpD
MALLRMAPIASRLLVLVPLCGATMLGGCGHRRQSMRPVYVGPAVPAATCAPAMVDGNPPAIVDDRNPPAIDSAADAPVVSPGTRSGRSSIDSSVAPSGRTGTTPPAPNEPNLRMPADPAPERTPKSNISPPPSLDGPAASRNQRDSSTTRTTSVSRSKLATVRERVRPFVNDADDLFQPPKADRPWKFIVVHHSAQPTGSYDQIDREHRKIQGWDGCGYHFVIGNGTDSPDGQIEVARRWTNQKHGLHCKTATDSDVNEYGIGICLIGDFDKNPPTAKQIAATKALVAYLSQRYNVAPDHAGTHGDMAGVASACPGKLFPEEQIFGSKHLAKN